MFPPLGQTYIILTTGSAALTASGLSTATVKAARGRYWMGRPAK
jgi:hypothetical protein